MKQATADAASDASQRRRLNAMSWTATGLLLAMAAVFVTAHRRIGFDPVWGYIAAFSEAAMVGAMADWFAVVALFRHPLGIPIWHTAIIPNSKDDIAKNLGEFVETHFVTIDAIVERIRDYDPAAKLADWLIAPENGEKVGSLLTTVARKAVASIDDRRMRAEFGISLANRFSKQNFAGPIAELGFKFVADKRHQQMLDWALKEAAKWLKSDGAQATAMAIAAEMKWLPMKDNVAGWIIAAAQGQVDAALSDKSHAIRAKYDGYIKDWLVRLKTEPDLTIKLQELQGSAATSPQVAVALENLWSDAKAWLNEDLAQERPAIAGHASTLARQIGERIGSDSSTQHWINDAIVSAIIPLVTENRGKVAEYIQAQIGKWSKEEMTERLELAVGRDLQFIRINGTIVGGLVGCAIYAVSHLL